jgi:hypothetical protein
MLLTPAVWSGRKWPAWQQVNKRPLFYTKDKSRGYPNKLIYANKIKKTMNWRENLPIAGLFSSSRSLY